MPEPLSPTIGFGMNVAVLPYACAVLWTAYFSTCSQSARWTSGAKRVPISHWPAFATSWWCTSTGTPICSSARHMAERMSCSESTGGTGKYPPLTVGRWPMLPPSNLSPVDHAASDENTLQ